MTDSAGVDDDASNFMLSMLQLILCLMDNMIVFETRKSLHADSAPGTVELKTQEVLGQFESSHFVRLLSCVILLHLGSEQAAFSTQYFELHSRSEMPTRWVGEGLAPNLRRNRRLPFSNSRASVPI